MADNTIPQNLVPSEPHLIDLLKLWKKDILLNFNCHHIGTIQTFDPSDQTATATINYKKTFFEFNEITGVYSPVLVNYPLLTDCPVIFLGGGSTSLTFPIKTGDECIIIFNDRDLDNWFAGSSSSPNSTARLHSFSDGMILVGLRSSGNVISNFDSTRALLQSGSVAVGINPSNSKVLLTNTYPNNSSTLKNLIQSVISNVQDLISAINNNAAAFIPVTGAPGGPSPLSPAVIAALTVTNTSLTTLSTQVGGMLE